MTLVFIWCPAAKARALGASTAPTTIAILQGIQDEREAEKLKRYLPQPVDIGFSEEVD